ncbi:hypothetical protein [Loktanella sp. Alg231-35]|uniref:hypothetical protein n=1 Tax=Loktanella sp. Alg231-35 TaxID=1922220 RepID=UPI000D5593AA|nr:hypothetical protein [Loktanella sp. Alg231-35]
MAGDISQFLLGNGPSLTGDILRHLENSGLTADAARQRLSRKPKTIKSLTGISFPKNARFYYHESQFGTHRYWDGLFRAVTEGSPAYGPAIAAMTSHGGVVPKDFFPIVSGAPLKQKNKTGSDAVLSRLSAVGLLRESSLGDMPVISLNHNLRVSVDSTGLPARMTVQRILLDAIAEWARKLGMASYDKIAIRERGNALPQFGTHTFDLCGPSYLAPITRYKSGKPSPGFLICDVFVGDVGLATARGFIRKCANSRAMKRLPPFLPIIVANGFEPAAFKELRAYGIIATKPSALFGREVARGLAGLLETLQHASAIAAANPEVIETLFGQLGQIEGAAQNLRGALFELIVGHIVSREGAISIDIGRRAHVAENTSFEIDVFGYAAQDVRLIECKGYAPTHRVDAEEVEAWIRTKARRLHKHFRVEDAYQNREFTFEFWTSGDFTAEALELADQVSAETDRYKVTLLNGSEVRKRITKVNAKGLGKVFDEHYAKHPISKLGRKYEIADQFGSVVEPI